MAPNAIIIIFFFSVSGLLVTDRNAIIIFANIVHKKWSNGIINVGLMAARITLYILWGHFGLIKNVLCPGIIPINLFLVSDACQMPLDWIKQNDIY